MRPDRERGRTEEKLTNMLQLCPLLQSANFAPGLHNSGYQLLLFSGYDYGRDTRLFGAIAIHVKTHFWSLLKLKCAQRNMQIKVLIEMNTEHQSFPIKNGLYLIVAITSFYITTKLRHQSKKGRALQGLSPVKLRFHLLISILGPSPLLWP